MPSRLGKKIRLKDPQTEADCLEILGNRRRVSQKQSPLEREDSNLRRPKQTLSTKVRSRTINKRKIEPII